MINAIGRRVATLLLLAAMSVPAWAQQKTDAKAKAVDAAAAAPQPITLKINGRVIDEAGKPAVGVSVSRAWNQGPGANGVLVPYEAVKTDANGSFSTEMSSYPGRAIALASFIFDKSGKHGGLVVVDPANAQEPVTIKLGPLVHLHGRFECTELGRPVGWTNTMIFTIPGNARIVQFQSDASDFDFLLPPGNYKLRGYGSSDFGQEKRDLALSADKPEVDLGSIGLAASNLAKLKGKPAPELHPSDARGVNKNVQIADYRGKWVALEFWGYWCGPCVGGALPEMMQIYDDHDAERDRFVILTVHSPETKTFAELDEKVKPVVRDMWAGRMIPFPILLDADSKLQKTFDVSHWPTTLLFDPDGKLIGEVQPDTLEQKLNKVPPEIALPRKLDRSVTIGFRDNTLAQVVTVLKVAARAEFELDKEAVAALGLTESTKVPLVFSGMVSLRSLLDLLLDPLELTARIGSKGFVITRKPKAETTAEVTQSKLQQFCAERIERKLKESKQTFKFDKTSLSKVAAFFEQQTNENVVLDPRGRLHGKINPDAPITASGTDVPTGEALTQLLQPLGLRIAVRDEVIVIEPK